MNFIYIYIYYIPLVLISDGIKFIYVTIFFFCEDVPHHILSLILWISFARLNMEKCVNGITTPDKIVLWWFVCPDKK